VAGTVDGITYRIGKASWCTNETPLSGNNNELTVMLSRDNRPVATFTLGDALRDDAVECIRQLQQHSIHCSILSGDHTQAVEQIAMQLGIKDLHRDCSPANKVVQIEAMKKIYGTVAMVGDGINDGPVLAHADVSVALAEASHTAQLAADVLLLNNRLSDLFTLKEMSLRTRRIARQNLAWALIYNISILPLAAAGLLPPVLAALGMAISSLLVTLNALRLFSATAH
jgi:Cu2+-exporting ATPase